MATAQDPLIVEYLKLFNCSSCEELYSKLEQIHTEHKPVEGEHVHFSLHDMKHLSTSDKISTILCSMKIYWRANKAAELIKDLRENPPRKVLKISFSCDVCNTKIRNSSALMKHKLIHPEGKTYFSWDICNKSYPSSTSFKKHNLSAGRLDMLKRENNGSQFNDIITHKSEVDEIVKKEIMEDEFMDVAKLLILPVESNVQINERVSISHTEHKESHEWNNDNKLTVQSKPNSGKKSFPCDNYGKVFSLNGNLKVHKRIHTRPFPCDLCDKAFTTSSKLTVHKNIHTGLKPYSCDICSKSFSQNSDLTGHKRIHTREIPFSCDVCNIKITNSSALMKHKLIHKEGKSYDEESFQNADKLYASVYILEDSQGIKMEDQETKDIKEEIIIKKEMNFEEDPLSCQQNYEEEFRYTDIVNHKIEN